MENRVMLSVSLALAAGIANAQQINRIIGRQSESNRVEDATVLANNDIALAGERYYFSPFTVTATLSRTAPDGTPIWSLSMDVADELDTGFGVRELEDKTLLFGFHTGSSNQSLALARVNGAGVPIWVRSYPGGSGFGAAGLEIDRTIVGEFGMVANRFDNLIGNYSGQLLRIDTFSGTVVTNRSYATNGETATSAHFNDLAFVRDTGDYFVTGAVTRFLGEDRYDTDILVARIQRFSGGVVWSKAYTLPPTEDSTRYEEGYSIELATDGSVFVVARADNEFEPFGPPGAVHLRLDPANGNLLASSFIPDVQPAYASLDKLSNGHLLASGSRTFGDGQSQAQMWEIDPVTAVVLWRAEYIDGQTRGNDAVEHITPEGRFLFLTGSNYPFSIPSIGSPDQMFLQTDASGDDGCSSVIWIPDHQVPEISVNAVVLSVASVAESSSLQTENFRSVLDTAIVCRAGACVGDLNNDGFVDDADFVIFVNAYNILDCLDPSMPPGCPADLNQDGFVDDADFVIFVAAYNELVCPE